MSNLKRNWQENRFFRFLLLLTGFQFFAITFFAVFASNGLQQYLRANWLLFVMYLIALVAFGMLAKPQDEKPKPRLVACECDGVHMLVAGEDFDLAVALRERGYIAYPEDREKGLRPEPQQYCLFSDHPPFLSGPAPLAYPMSWMSAVTKGCVVVDSEMDIPVSRKHGYWHTDRLGRLAFDRFWRVVHGPDVKPPENLV